jgi:gas vesicle protein
MNRVVTGLLVGVGVLAGLMVLLTREKKTQRFLRARWQQLRSAFPEPGQVRQSAQQVADRVSQAATTMKQTGQDITDKTKQLVKQR